MIKFIEYINWIWIQLLDVKAVLSSSANGG